jgi:hypothetical protein
VSETVINRILLLIATEHRFSLDKISITTQEDSIFILGDAIKTMLEETFEKNKHLFEQRVVSFRKIRGHKKSGYRMYIKGEGSGDSFTFLSMLLVLLKEKLDIAKKEWVEKGKDIIRETIQRLLSIDSINEDGNEKDKEKIFVFYKKGVFTARFNIKTVQIMLEHNDPREFEKILAETIFTVIQIAQIHKLKEREKKKRRHR